MKGAGRFLPLEIDKYQDSFTEHSDLVFSFINEIVMGTGKHILSAEQYR